MKEEMHWEVIRKICLLFCMEMCIYEDKMRVEQIDRI